MSNTSFEENSMVAAKTVPNFCDQSEFVATVNKWSVDDDVISNI